MRTSIDRAMDAQHVKRWSLCALTADSNVASHSFNVAILSVAIYQRVFPDDVAGMHNICYMAMLHDIEEVFTGDIPTPTKTLMRDNGVCPRALFGEYEEFAIAPDAKTVMKLADLIDNWYFISQHGVGVRARIATNEVRDRLIRAISDAPPGIRDSAMWVLDYVENRRSEYEKREHAAKTDKDVVR